MIQTPTYGDERVLAYCTFCGDGRTETRDHCPSRVLLDEPFPENLPVVPSCRRCNARFSQDEEYLACLISCVLAGTTVPSKIFRPKIQRILSGSPALRARIEASRVESDGKIIFNPEQQRVSTVITKLAQGHALYELHEPQLDQPKSVAIRAFNCMTEAEIEAFESPCSEGVNVWPEVGSRAIQHLLLIGTSPEYPWHNVQTGMYRFHASVDAGVSIRIVIQEYLACHVRWD